MVQWIKNGSIIDNDSVELNNNMYVSTMTLSSISASDAGTYNCTVVVGSDSEYIVNSSEVKVVEIITIHVTSG